MKKLLAVLLCAATLFSVISVPCNAVVFNSQTAQMAGDVNGDGAVNALDVNYFKQKLLGKDIEIDTVAANVSGDNSLNTQDMFTLKTYIVGKTSELVPSTGTSVHRILIAGVEIAGFEISLPADATENMEYAAKELQHFINVARGVSLPIVTDSAAENTIALVSDTTGELGDEGVDISVANGDVIITGGIKRGCMYGAYEFLERFVGLVFINKDEIHVNKNPLMEIADGEHYRHIPKVLDRDSQTNSYEWYGDDENGNRVPNNEKLEAALRLKTSSWKNRGILEKSEKYGYSVGYTGSAHSLASYIDGLTNEKQICYNTTANFEAVRDGVLAKIANEKERGYPIQSISVAPMDNTNYCSCRKCRKQNQDNEAYMGSQLIFVNRIAEEVEKLYPDVHVITTAYTWCRKPPTQVVPRHNVDILYCWAGCNNHPFDGSQCNIEQNGNWQWMENYNEHQYFERWCEITEGRIYCWIYATSYAAMLGQASLFGNMRENIKYLADHGVYGIYCEGYYNTPENYKDGNCFDLLLMYMFLRCQWDPDMTDEEFDAYMDEFIGFYYGDGVAEVRKYLELNEAATDAREACWANNCDLTFSSLDLDYLAEHGEEIIASVDSARAKATNATQQDHIDHLATSAYWIVLCATYASQYENGDEAQRALYTERYERMHAWMVQYDMVNLDGGKNGFNPDDNTVVDPIDWTGGHGYYHTKIPSNPVNAFSK